MGREGKGKGDGEMEKEVVTRNVRRILVRGVNAPVPAEAKKVRKL